MMHHDKAVTPSLANTGVFNSDIAKLNEFFAIKQIV